MSNLQMVQGWLILPFGQSIFGYMVTRSIKWNIYKYL